MASIYQRTNPNGAKVWRAVIRMKGHPVVCKHFDRKQEAEDWVIEREQQIKQGKYSPNKAEHKTLSDLLDVYIPDAVVGHHKAFKDTIRELEYFRERLGGYALIYITPEVLLSERRILSETSTKKGALRNPATVNRYFATLGGAFRYGVKTLRWIGENPCGNLLKLKAKPKQRRTLREDEEICLLNSCRASQSPYLYCIVLFGITTGARKSEILNLKWDDINFDTRIAHIRDSKNEHPRYVCLVDSVIQELKRLHAARDTTKPLVFASKTAFGKVDIKKAWQSALKRAGIEGFVFHGLRHHFCTKGVDAGASGLQLRSQLGHTTSRMTDLYSAHLDAQTTRFIGESIEQRILGGQDGK